MRLFSPKTNIYLSAFIVAMIAVTVTVQLLPRPQLALGGDVDADKACEGTLKGVAPEDKYKAMSWYGNATENITDCYHATVNKIFNKAIADMVKLGKTGKEADLLKMIDLITPPPLDKHGNRTCRADENKGNLSTYCLSEKLVIEFARFRAGMLLVRQDLKANAGAEAARMEGKAEITKKDLRSLGEKINDIDTEIQVANRALDQGLAAYNELQFSLPLHLKYKKVISALETYRDKLAKIRSGVTYYPVSFVDVTTAACN